MASDVAGLGHLEPLTDEERRETHIKPRAKLRVRSQGVDHFGALGLDLLDHQHMVQGNSDPDAPPGPREGRLARPDRLVRRRDPNVVRQRHVAEVPSAMEEIGDLGDRAPHLPDEAVGIRPHQHDVAGPVHHQPGCRDRVAHGLDRGHGARHQLASLHDRGVHLDDTGPVCDGSLAGVEDPGVFHRRDDRLDHIDRLGPRGQGGVCLGQGLLQIGDPGALIVARENRAAM